MATKRPTKRPTKRDKRYRQLALAVAGGQSRFEAGRRLGLDRATIAEWYACPNWKHLVQLSRDGLTVAAAIQARAEMDARRPAVDALFASARHNKTEHEIDPAATDPTPPAPEITDDSADGSTDAPTVVLCDVRTVTNRPDFPGWTLTRADRPDPLIDRKDILR